MNREGINSDELPPPIGPFSHAVKAGELIFLSGQVGQDPKTGKLIEGDVSAQAEQAFDNLQKVLKAVGRDLSHVVKVNVYLTGMSDFAAMNQVYARHFTAPYPARTTVAVAELPLGAKLEIELVAR